jgi:hypothetical protein
MILASRVAALVRELTKARDIIEFGDLVRRIYGLPYAELKPIQREIVVAELVEIGWRKRGKESVWVK